MLAISIYSAKHSNLYACKDFYYFCFQWTGMTTIPWWRWRENTLLFANFGLKVFVSLGKEQVTLE